MNNIHRHYPQIYIRKYDVFPIAFRGNIEQFSRYMSLVVYAYERCPDTQVLECIKQPTKETPGGMFGPETWRQKVWGSKAIANVGCQLLPSLINTNIYAQGEDLEVLSTELRLILENIDFLSRNLNIDKLSLRFRINNALTCIALAQAYENGGVAIE